MKSFYALLLIMLSAYSEVVHAQDPADQAPELVNSYQLSNDNHFTTDGHAFVDAAGVASLIYATRISYENDPYDDFLSYMTFDGLAHGVTGVTSTNDAVLGVRSPTIVYAHHIHPDHPSTPPGLYRHHAAYIHTGNCFMFGNVPGAVVYLTSCDGGTTWDMCGTGTILPDLYGVSSLDMAIDHAVAAPYDKMAVAFARDTDGDGDSDTLYYALNSCDNMACFYSPVIVAQEDPAHPQWEHHFSDVTLQVDAAGKYHVLYLDAWEKESPLLSSRRIMYATNAVGGSPLPIASFTWDSAPGLSRKSLHVSGSQRHAVYSEGANVHIVASSDGLSWAEELAFGGSQASISGGSSTLNVAYVNENGSVVYIEDDGTGWSDPFEVSPGGHDPFMAANDIREEDGTIVGVARYVFYFNPDPPRTDMDEIYVRTDQLMQDRIPPYVRLIWPVSGVWTSENTAIYGQDQEVPRLAEECRINEFSYHPCDFTSAGTKLGELPEYSSIPDNGLFTLGIRDHDAAMNYGVDSQPGVRKDGLAPTTSDDYGAYDGIWQASAQTVTLTPGDPGEAGVSGSGLDCSLYNYGTYCQTWTKYCLAENCLLDDQNGLLYSAALDISEEGTTILRYASRDVAGNIQSPVTRTVLIDYTAPQVNAGPDLVARAAVFIDAASNDTPSGVAAWQWSKESGPGAVNFSAGSSEDTTVSMSEDGLYALRLTVTDRAGRAQNDEATVTWDTTSPVVTLNGEAEVTIEVGSAYSDAGAVATDNLDVEISSRLAVSGLVDADLLGDYTITYDVTDHAGNVALPAVRTVHVVDTQRPLIELNGTSPVSVEVGSSYTDAGATVTDNYDVEIASRLVVENPVNIEQVGTYVITYNATDSSGNAAFQVERTVYVVDTQSPLIELRGSAFVEVQKYADYQEQGALASDNYDGDVSGALQVVSLVDTSVVGTYSVTYTVTDSNGNAAVPAVRTVRVVSRGRPNGDLTPLAVISTLKPSGRKFILTASGGRRVAVRPFGSVYRGKVWARQIDFGPETGALYVFAPLGANQGGFIKIFGPDGRLLKSLKPLGSPGASGFNPDIVMEVLNDVVYLALGVKKKATAVRVYELNPQGLKLNSMLPAGRPAGNTLCRFLQLYPIQSGLVTALNGKKLKVWRYGPGADRFEFDSTYDLGRLRYLRGDIHLK